MAWLAKFSPTSYPKTSSKRLYLHQRVEFPQAHPIACPYTYRAFRPSLFQGAWGIVGQLHRHRMTCPSPARVTSRFQSQAAARPFGTGREFGIRQAIRSITVSIFKETIKPIQCGCWGMGPVLYRKTKSRILHKMRRRFYENGPTAEFSAGRKFNVLFYAKFMKLAGPEIEMDEWEEGKETGLRQTNNGDHGEDSLQLQIVLFVGASDA